MSQGRAGAEPAGAEQADSLAHVKSQRRFQRGGKDMRREEHFFAETIARRPTFCHVVVVKFLNEARNRAHAPPQVFKEYGGAVSG